MKLLGIIAEYNPFHNGHAWHLQAARRRSGCDGAVAVMSGNFVQRGEPAVQDKWLRAEAAVACGADLVVELPAVFTVRSAEHFAIGGIRLLQALGVQCLAFGAEDADLPLLTACAQALDRPSNTALLHSSLKQGLPYAAALTRGLSLAGVEAKLVQSPNNILALEYLRALHKYAPDIEPLALSRQQAEHNSLSLSAPFASASAIRNSLKQKGLTSDLSAVMPVESLKRLQMAVQEGRGPLFWDNLENSVFTVLRRYHLDEIQSLADVSEGLEHKIYKAVRQTATAADLLDAIKSKRYPRTRLQRILVQALLGITKTTTRRFDETGPLYIRVLAFNETGRKIIRQANVLARLPVIVKTADFLHALSPQPKAGVMFGIDLLSTDLYMLGMPSPVYRQGSQDFLRSPVYDPN